MEEEFTPIEEKKISIFDTFVNLLTSPSELFSTVVKGENRASNYFVPIIASIIAGIIFIFIVFSQPSIQYQQQEMQNNAMQQMVADGKMTAEQFESAVENNPAKPGSPMFMVFGSIGILIGSFAILFLLVLILWIVGKIAFSSQAKYLKTTEVVGLSSYVTVIGSFVTLIFVLGFDSLFAGPNLAIFVNEFDIKNKIHLLLKSIDILMIWYLYILSIGLSALWETNKIKSVATVFSLWGIYLLITIYFGMKFAGS